MIGHLKEETPGVTAEGFSEQGIADTSNSPTMPHSAQALRSIDGERLAAEYLARLDAEQTDPDEMAVIVSMLYGATLRGFCRVLEKALGVKS